MRGHAARQRAQAVAAFEAGDDASLRVPFGQRLQPLRDPFVVGLDQAELAEVDGEIKQVEDNLQPKTIGEVQELETKLKEALQELGRIKAEIEKK